MLVSRCKGDTFKMAYMLMDFNNINTIPRDITTIHAESLRDSKDLYKRRKSLSCTSRL